MKFIRPLNASEKGILILALLLIGVGAFMAIHPMEYGLTHPGYRQPHATSEHVSKNMARCYGLLAVACGSIIVWLISLSHRK